MSLAPEHLADLKKSRLMDEMIALCQFRSARPHDIRRFKSVDSALVIPYFDLDGKPTTFERLKFFPPLIHVDGTVQKYSQEHGSDSELYIPPLHPWKEIAADPTQVIVVTEGEKKSACGCQAGLFCVGISGVWNWRIKLDRHERMVVPGLDLFVWQDRAVEMVPDSDLWRKEKFKALCGFYALGMELVSRGAMVKFVQLPDSAQGKVGLDDWMVHQ
jgi:Domain of unknown function (DUF3854)